MRDVQNAPGALGTILFRCAVQVRSGMMFLLYRRQNAIVRILYKMLAFNTFDDFGDFVKSRNYGTSETCRECGSNPCRGAIAQQCSPLPSVARGC